MPTNFESRLNKYAELVTRVGVNVQPDQRLMMWRVPLEGAELARLVAASSYRCGAPLVDVLWEDDGLTLARFENASPGSFEHFPNWISEGMQVHVEAGGALLSIRGNDPDLLAKQEPALIGQVAQVSRRKMRPVMNYVTGNAINWCVIAVPTRAWAKKIYPELTPDKAVAALWDTIFTICRVDEPDPVAAWKTHIARLQERSTTMNERRFSALHLTAPGTDLMIGLPEGHVWKGGAGTSAAGIPFTANIPTEEIFTLPHRQRVEGRVKATLPLSYGGAIIDDFSLEFVDGRVVDLRAGTGEEILQKMIESDEGAAHLGEIALVPNSSPIAQTGRLFYHTLYDENASCHIALGRAADSNSLQRGTEMTPEELTAVGYNDSIIHVDFMIGSDQMDIDGITASGGRSPVMQQGEWAFDE